jgi:hypothetical protein
MKVLFSLLALSLIAILVAVGAMLWRLRWHLRRSPATGKNQPLEVQPDHKGDRVDAGTN